MVSKFLKVNYQISLYQKIFYWKINALLCHHGEFYLYTAILPDASILETM